MRDIYIIGSGGFAKEVFFLIEEINLVEEVFNFCGFIDYMPKEKELIVGEKKYCVFDEKLFLNSMDTKEAAVAIGIGSPENIYKVTEKYKSYLFPNLIHPSVIAKWDSIKLGVGNVITNNCTLTVDIQIGSFNIFNIGTVVGHDAIIGSFNAFMPRIQVSGASIIGDTNFFGMNCSILQCVTIGDKNKIGAHSLVTKDVGNSSLVVGIPALKKRDL